MRIAMWSGPRNLSTAMMYSFGARSDFAVVDEPFYAAYLAQTGLDHPMRTEILASQSQEADRVAQMLRGPIPDARPHFYQKHMTQHMIPAIPRDWMAGMKHVFLIRHPARVIASYGAKRENPSLEDIGFSQQTEIFQMLRDQGETPVVIDSYDIRQNPEKMLRRLCAAIDLPFDPAMLSWPKGPHPCDGIWAAHWYGAVHDSTGFAGAEGPLPEISEDLQPVLAAALPLYKAISAFKL